MNLFIFGMFVLAIGMALGYVMGVLYAMKQTEDFTSKLAEQTL